ncbi:RNA-binding motif protein, X-linked 2 [Leucoagaricus sp. SymC.cos]|nr:RNA-binding motif protein, X-linked 2 [Leucoagaricus sp. SymC.cos]
MNVVREINRINEAELVLGSGTASWHDDYKDSAYVFIGGLHSDLTEGDVITIFSQYGEVMDVNLPRDKETGKTKSFGFLMYEDQRSTILAVDNLNGAKVLDRILRVDHVKNYKQPKIQNEDGEWADAEEQSLNAKPQLIVDEDGENSDSSESSGPDIDPEDPMRDYLIAKWKEEHAANKPKKKKSKGKRKDETSEERAARKARRKEKKSRKVKSEGVRGVEDLLNSLARREPDHGRSRSRAPPGRLGHRSRSRSHTPVYEGRQKGFNRRSPDRHGSRSHKRRRYSDEERDGSRDRHE